MSTYWITMIASSDCECSGCSACFCCEQFNLVAQLKELMSVSNPTTDGIIFILLPALMYCITADLWAKLLNWRHCERRLLGSWKINHFIILSDVWDEDRKKTSGFYKLNFTIRAWGTLEIPQAAHILMKCLLKNKSLPSALVWFYFCISCSSFLNSTPARASSLTQPCFCMIKSSYFPPSTASTTACRDILWIKDGD